MKSSIVLPLMAIAVIAASILHFSRKNTSDVEDNIDKLAIGLQPVKAALAPNTKLTLRPVGVGTETLLEARYLLAPHYCSVNPAEKLDTILFIFTTGEKESVLHACLDGKTLIAQSADDRFRYMLSVNHDGR